MRLALLSDIHANAPALRAALQAVSEHGVDRIIVAGDLVGDGPFPSETLDLLMGTEGLSAVRGNVDRRIVRLLEKKRKKIERRLDRKDRDDRNQAWTVLQIDNDQGSWLEGLPSQLSFAAEGLEVLVVHGSPLGDGDSIYPSITEEGLARKLAPLSDPRPDVLVSGHTHVPFARAMGPAFVINCGSVGRPVDGDPRGSFAIAELNRETRARVDVYRFEYPVEEVEAALRDREVPGIRIADYSEGVKS